MKEFVHLHLHTEYSMLDGMAKISEVTKLAKNMGMPAIAMTDHGNMYGAVAFFDACTKVGIKPIFGTEFYVCDNLYEHSKVVREDDASCGYKDRRHLVLLVKNEEGYKNISLLNAIAFREGFYYKPRIDLKTLAQHSEGLICMSACLGGDIPQSILRGDFALAEELVQFFKKTFGEDFYLELQNHGLEEQKLVNSYLKMYAEKYDIKTVVTNDVHYLRREDAEAQDVMMCVQTKSSVDDANRMRMNCDEFYFKSYDELAEAFPDDLDSLDRTLEIADKCNFSFVYGKYMFPHYKPENGDDPYVYINKLIDEGIQKKLGGVRSPEYDERIKMELGVISKQGFIEYYLIVWDYINAARRMGIAVGPGRGSGAGSLVAYLIGITDIDPMKYDLYFERFLNAERVSAPDFDVDFEDSRRQEVIEYVKRRYGADSVCNIVTFGTMAAKNVIKDIGRAMKVPYSELDKVTKSVPDKITVNGEAFKLSRPMLRKILGFEQPKKDEIEAGLQSYVVPEIKEIYDNNQEMHKVLDIAMKLEDMPRQASTHACGVIIGADILDRHMPLSRNDETITSQYTGVELEHLGFLKMDFLGLRNLSDIKLCIEYVKQNHGVDVVFDRDHYDDPKVYELISSGNTKGIFQIESAGFQDFLSKLKPTCLEDIVAAVSLFRPGPMNSIGRFIESKHNPEKIVYDHPLLKPILQQTYGCIVYQEQVMKIVQSLAGYTLGQADMVRRMMGKKKVEDMKKEVVTFINGKPETEDHGKISTAIDGCLKRGVPKEVAEKVWDEMKDFAKYAFNKSHAAAYSLVTYQTAYLKCYYKAEFLTALLNNRITKIEEIINYAQYAKDEGIPVLQPDINESQTYFSVKNNMIRFGLAAVKNVGIGVVDEIISEREKNGKFKSFEDFCLRCTASLNKRMVANLIMAGAFDCFGIYRSKLIMVHEDAIDKAQEIFKDKEKNAISIFTLLGEKDEITLEYPDIPDWDKFEKFKREKEVSGLYITGHPLESYESMIKACSFNTSKLLEYEENEETGEFKYLLINDGDRANMIGMITSIKKVMTKKGESMAILTLEDIYGSIEAPLFPKIYKDVKDKIEPNKVVKIEGRIGIRNDKFVSIGVDKLDVIDLEKKRAVVPEIKPVAQLGLRAKKEDQDDILEILSAYPGDIPAYLKIDGKLFNSHLRVRKCPALISELESILDPEDIIFMENK